MIIKTVELKNYRNYESLELPLGRKVNILYGDNAQGKTNVLESIFMCATTKSHRGTHDRDIIKMGEEEAHIRMNIEKTGIPHKIDMHLKKNKAKGVAVDGIKITKSVDFFGMLNVVFFSPEDLNIIKNGPAERRRFMDMELCQLNKMYMHELTLYNKILAQRNNLLKQLQVSKEAMDTLSVWDEQLVAHGINIINDRNVFLSELNEIVRDIHERISGGKEMLSAEYQPNVSKDEFLEKLKRTHERDIYTKTTNAGPHRDEIRFTVDATDLKVYGSQGQQRTAALALKLAEIELVKKKTGENPVLLLDDVLSELDRNRQHYLLNSIEGIQTLITCTGMEEFVGDRQKYDSIFYVENGKIESK